MSWLDDASANKIVQSYVNNFMDVSGNFKVRHSESTTVDTGPVSWSQLGSDIDGEASSDYSGVSVALSSDGTIVAVGAHGNDGAGSNAGHVRVYELKMNTLSSEFNTKFKTFLTKLENYYKSIAIDDNDFLNSIQELSNAIQ